MRAPIIALCLASAGPALAQEAAENVPPPVFQAVVDCRTIAEPAARLSCYDQAVEELSDAQAEKRVVIADREQIRQARRGLFGFTLPNFKLFSSGGEDQMTEIESTIRSARQGKSGKWTFVLEDSAKWTQTDTRYVAVDPGDPIRIRRGVMGGYLANVDGGVAIRVRRTAD